MAGNEQNGRAFMLAMEDSASPASYVDIAGMLTTGLEIQNNPVDVTTKDDAGIQCMAAAAGNQSMTVSADGRYQHVAVHDLLEDAAFSRTANNYRLTFGNADTIEGTFVIETYARAGADADVETFSLALRRTGASATVRA